MFDYFDEFLTWCVKQREITRFIIAGDLMDSPAEPDCNVFTCPNPTGKKVLARLAQLAQDIEVTYVVGNHDIGVNEFTYTGMQSPPFLPNASLSYPGVVLDAYMGGVMDPKTGKVEKTTVMVDHGHFSDPLIGIYENDLARSIYYCGSSCAAAWPHLGGTPVTPRFIASGAAQPIVTQPGQTAYDAARANQDNSAASPADVNAAAKHGGWLDKSTQELRRRWWWGRGLDQMEAYLNASKPRGMTRLYLIEGHTHLMDARDAQTRDGIPCYYINAGTWEDGYGTANYVEIDDSGECWLQDWIKEPMATKQTTSGASDREGPTGAWIQAAPRFDASGGF